MVTEADGKTRTVHGTAWTGGATPMALRQQAIVGERLALDIYGKMQAHPAYGEWLTAGRSEREWLLGQSRSLPAPRNQAALYGIFQGTIIDIEYRQVLRDALAIAFELRWIMDVDEFGLVPMGPHPVALDVFASQAQLWAELAYAVLDELEVTRQRWRGAAVLAHLLDPDVALEILPMPYWMGSPETPRAPATCQAGTALGSPYTTEQVGLKAKNAWRTAWGEGTVRGKSGPKRGSQRGENLPRQAFEKYVIARHRAGVSPQMIADDAEANRLYRTARRDHAIQLSDQTVRSILRKANKSR